MIKKGRYRLITFDDQEVPIISTTFYIDGDALNEINQIDNKVLAENHPDKLDEHLKKVELHASSINVLIKQIQAVSFALFASLPWFYYSYDQVFVKLGVSGFLGLLVYFARKWIPKVVVKIVGKIF